MSELLVSHIAEMYGVPADELKATLEDEAKAKEFFETQKESTLVYKKDEFEKLLTNKQNEYLEQHAKSEKIHPDIYKRVSGTVKEMTEKNIAKRFDIGEYSNLDDLLDKAEAKLKVAQDSDEKDKKITELKALVKTVEREKEEAVNTKNKEVDKFIISSVMTKAVADLPLDFEGEQVAIQREIVLTMFEKKYALERREDKIIAINRQTQEVIKDRVGDPVEVGKLLSEFAPTVTKLKTVPGGGRGDNSSTKQINTDLAKITNEEEFRALLKAKGITNPGSKEAMQLLQEVKKANPNFKMV